jgi:hypothetical protein
VAVTACPPPKLVRAGTDVVAIGGCSERPAVPGVAVRGRELWAGRTRLTRRLPLDDGLTQTPEPLLRSPDGRWVVWIAAVDSGSVTADGLPLRVTRVAAGGRTTTLAPKVLAYPDYVAWCGGRLVFVAGGRREATWANKRLMTAAPPRWRPRPLGSQAGLTFGSLACAPDGRAVAVLSQRASRSSAFFSTRWQLWRVGLDGRRTLLDRPPAGWADESPRFARDGTLFFVRERNGRGFVRRLGGTAPVVALGYSTGYYGHHDWPYRVS